MVVIIIVIIIIILVVIPKFSLSGIMVEVFMMYFMKFKD